MLRRFQDVGLQRKLPALLPERTRTSEKRSAQMLRWPFELAGRLVASDRVVGRLMAALYADLAGYTRLFHRDDVRTVVRLRHMYRLLRPIIRWHGGRIVQTGGDSLLVTFHSVGGALKCAVTIQHVMARENDGWPEEDSMRLRVGVDLGDVIREGRDFHGSGIIVAVRLQEVCPPGGVCVSRAAHDRGGCTRLGLPFEPVGELVLKNVPQPVEAFVLRPPDGRTIRGLRLVE
jgi:adenylate cyclase